jgi:nucleoside 2-deoxyribosyltransferase
MRVYLAAPIRGDRSHVSSVRFLADTIERMGWELLTPQVIDPSLEGLRSDGEIFRDDMSLIHGCDLLVAEVSSPSIGVGYELAIGIALGKRVLALHRRTVSPDALSAMVRGNPAPNLRVATYESNDGWRAMATRLHQLMAEFPSA